MSYIAKNGRLYTSGASEALTLLDDKFSVNKSYSKGDSCIYNDYLWKFISNKPAGEWDNSVVGQCRIMDFIDDVNDRINRMGWKLSPPTNVAIVNFDEATKITWTDPDDVVISGGIAASWAGTKVIRKEGSAPTSPTDGVEVVNETTRNQYQNTPVVDTGLTNGVTYYYGIFPYTDVGVYNLQSVTSFIPSEIILLEAPVINSIHGSDHTATIAFTSATAEASVKFVFKTGSAPTSPTDGTVFSPFTTSPAVITGLTNDTHYYVVAYAYTSVRTSEKSNVVEVTPREYVQFAFHYSENDSSPASVTYPAGYDNSDYTDTFYVDLSTGVPHYGDWDKTDDKNRWLFPKPCMLKYDGTVDYYLNENDETKKEDGTASDVANSSYAGNAMVEWGQDGRKLYWKIVPDSDGKGFTFVIASAQVDNDMQPWNHYNCKGEIAEHFYTPIYFGSSDGTRLRSISGGTNYVNNVATAELTLAKANNLTSDEIWNTEVYCDFLLTAMLCILISKSTNSQAKFGYGRCASGNKSAIGQGTMNGKGMFFGKSDQTSGVKVFGMENPWGNLWRRIAGLINANGTVKLKLTYGKQDGSTVEGYNTTGSGYISHGTMAGTSGGYTSHMNITNRGITPETISGSDSTYYCDGAWFNNGQVDYACVSGDWDDSLHVGCLCVNLSDTVSYAGAGIGAELSCKPLA